MAELVIAFRDFAKSANNNARVHKFAQNLKGARTIAWSKFHADDPQILDAIVQNLGATSSWLPEFEYPCKKVGSQVVLPVYWEIRISLECRGHTNRCNGVPTKCLFTENVYVIQTHEHSLEHTVYWGPSDFGLEQTRWKHKHVTKSKAYRQTYVKQWKVIYPYTLQQPAGQMTCRPKTSGNIWTT